MCNTNSYNDKCCSNNNDKNFSKCCCKNNWFWVIILLLFVGVSCFLFGRYTKCSCSSSENIVVSN